MFGSGTACVVCPVDMIKYLGHDLHIQMPDPSVSLAQRFYNDLLDIQVCLSFCLSVYLSVQQIYVCVCVCVCVCASPTVRVCLSVQFNGSDLQSVRTSHRSSLFNRFHPRRRFAVILKIIIPKEIEA